MVGVDDMSMNRDDLSKVIGIGLEGIPSDPPGHQNDLTCCQCQAPISKAPLNLPEGSVRALITLVIIFAGCIATVVWKDVPGALGVAFGTVITSYFNARGAQPK